MAGAVEAQASSERDKFELLPGDDLLMEGFRGTETAMLENYFESGAGSSLAMKKAGSQRARLAGPLET